MCASVAPRIIIGSLGAEAAKELIWKSIKDGTFIRDTLPTLINMYNNIESGKAATQHKHTMKDIQKFVSDLPKSIQEKKIHVVPEAFNSTPKFITYFQSAAMGTIALTILDVGQAIKRVGASLESIRSELAIANVSTIQGWDGGGFGGYVHRFVRNEMSAFDDNGVDKEGKYHYFYVWHPDTDWYTAFEERQAEHPLGLSFGGYDHDLSTICLRMRADREALKATTEYGRTAVLHLVIPAYQPLVVDTEFKFAEELFPLIVTGARHRGIDLVWIALRQDPETRMPELRFVSILPVIMRASEQCSSGFIGCYGVAMAGIAAVGIFPPCAPAAVAAAEGLLFSTAFASLAGHLISGVWERATRPGVEVLGDALYFNDFGVLG
ncbi:hypothetical protein FAUST_6233 [Fusarium austroamericanum]|uniref:Uncharacterized protein n=1 Tax=Fusarium austroamericanum TaxID=282268 RepID=A0AAN6BZD6_FUSAU|nr:hypothetical protein FAUST_6233 [Fusarium austroamericanum]